MSKSPHSGRILADGRIDLPEVTLFAASSKAIPATVRALRTCLAQIRPAEAILFTDDPSITVEPEGVRPVRVDKIESRADYSRFVLKELAHHIRTDFVLCVQWDGYILDADNWSDEFLSVDYIGAPWPHFDDGHDVGNGGFSLRSRRLLQACADDRISDVEAEDVAICRTARPWLEREYGIRFADRELACRFAYERTAARGDEFGFHGVFNMMEFMGRSEYRQTIASLDKGMLRRSDIIELLKGAIRRHDFKTIQILLKSILAPHSSELESAGIH